MTIPIILSGNAEISFPDCSNRNGKGESHKVRRLDGKKLTSQANNVEVKCLHCHKRFTVVNNELIPLGGAS